MLCLECNISFVPRKAGRPQCFCSRKCRLKNFYRHPNDTKETSKKGTCEICGTNFEKRKRHQIYCSWECYQKAWPVKNREMYNAKARERRRAKPEWYHVHEPKYYQASRKRKESIQPWTYLLKSRQAEAKLKNIPFDLTNEWAAKRWTGKCELTGLIFVKNNGSGPQPFSPSIDKIVSELGYIQSNCRFILWSINALKGSGNDETAYQIAEAFLKHKKIISRRSTNFAEHPKAAK